jgi:hypothetical protein
MCYDQTVDSLQERKMLVTRKSMFTGVTRTLDLPITPEQVALYENGALLQVAFPNLSDGEREFYKTGVTQEEWNEVFSSEEDDDDYIPFEGHTKKDL